MGYSRDGQVLDVAIRYQPLTLALPGGNAALEIAEGQFMVFRGDCPGVAGKGSSGSPLGTAQLFTAPSFSKRKS
jgi:hypothetical protein